jgi:hypothetical protein
MGGKEAGPINAEDHDFALWEKRVDALRKVVEAHGLTNVDSMRRALEDMGEEAFETMSYYERWMNATTQNLMEAGAFSIDELNAKMDEVQARGPTYGEAQGGGE